MLAGAPSTITASPIRRSSRAPQGLVCPRCDAPAELGATLCSSCGVTLGEPPRRSGVTQRAMAIDADAARLALEARAPTPAPVPVKKTSVIRSFWDGVFVVLTLGLGWLWLRQRAA